MKKNTSKGILIESESLKNAGTSREGDQVASRHPHTQPKTVGKDLLKKGKKS